MRGQKSPLPDPHHGPSPDVRTGGGRGVHCTASLGEQSQATGSVGLAPRREIAGTRNKGSKSAREKKKKSARKSLQPSL